MDASVAVLVDVQNTLVNNALLRWGSEEQKARYFPKLASSWVGAYALSEAGSGSDAFALACRAADKGDHFELTGRKLWITNAAEAELFIVLATVDPAKGYKGITAFLVERSFPGFQVGKKEDKLGIRASSTCELILEGCRVPARERAGRGRARATRSRSRPSTRGASGSAPRWWAWPRAPSSTALRYAQERQQFGKPIAEFQAVQFLLAELATRDRGLAPAHLQRGPPARRRVALHQGGGHGQAVRLARGRARDLEGDRDLRRATASPASTRSRSTSATRRSGQIYEGTTNMQLLVIAKQLLGKMA